jgi:hypothetical protein
MVIVRAFLALVAGFLTMALLVGIATALLVKLAPDFVGKPGHPRPTYVAFNLVYSFIAAAAGGYITAWIADQNPLIHALVLALVVLLLSALSAIQQRGKQPIAYQLTLVALSSVGVLLGALLRLKLTGIL